MMRKTIAISLAVLALTCGATRAEFKVTNPVPTQFPGTLMCGILQLAPLERDDDPINVIYVNSGFKYDGDKIGPLESLTVVHKSVFGKYYDRTTQYTNDYLAQTPGKLEILWRGSLKRKPSTKMLGRIWNESGSNRWFYSELITDGGAVSMKMLAGCHASEGD